MIEHLIVTCLDCLVAWDSDMDPPKCQAEDHWQVINRRIYTPTERDR